VDPGLYDVVRGCLIQEIRLDVIANNMANTGTSGFKRDTLSFDELLNVHQQIDMGQGNIRHTGNVLDLALFGEGFFKVNTPDGIRYTRNGRFYVNAEGQLATADGAPVVGDGGPIPIDGNEVSVDDAGRISVDGEAVGTLSIVSFSDPERLQKQGLSYYVYDGAQAEGGRPPETAVRQGYVEESNVAVTEEVIKMVETLRTFESYQKVLQTFDEANAKVINEVGKL